MTTQIKGCIKTTIKAVNRLGHHFNDILTAFLKEGRQFLVTQTKDFIS